MITTDKDGITTTTFEYDPNLYFNDDETLTDLGMEMKVKKCVSLGKKMSSEHLKREKDRLLWIQKYVEALEAELAK